MQGKTERHALPDKPYLHRGSVTTRQMELRSRRLPLTAGAANRHGAGDQP